MSDLVKRRYYPYPAEVVWAALTDRDALAQWLMPNNFEPEVGREFEFRVDPMMGMSGIVKCRVLELRAFSLMVWSWGIERGGGKPALATTIRFDLADYEGGTLLTLTQANASELPLFFRLSMAFGWGTMLKRWLPRVIGNVSRTPEGLRYTRLDPAPNRGHHRTRTVPEGFAK